MSLSILRRDGYGRREFKRSGLALLLPEFLFRRVLVLPVFWFNGNNEVNRGSEKR